MSITATIAAASPVARRVRAYFAPVDRSTGTPAAFDPAQLGRFATALPPSPWIDLGWISKFARKSATKIAPLLGGSPARPVAQVRTELDATVSCEFESWGKLQVALASGSQQMNLLKTIAGAPLNGSGGPAAPAVPLITSSGPAPTASTLNVGFAAAVGFDIGSLVAVDVDYAGQVGYVGSGISAAYVRSAAAVGGDIHYIRRVTLNVGVVAGNSAGILELGTPLLAGVPVAGMQVSQLTGFCDREGASFFQEWSGLFVMDGEQGDRILYHYPRLQCMAGSAEAEETLAAPLQRVRLAGAFRALPVNDLNDRETVLCFRSYLPAALRTI